MRRRSLIFWIAVPIVLSIAAIGQLNENILYSFGANPGDQAPTGGFVVDSAGNLYGITNAGGTNQQGSVIELSPNGAGWTESVIYSFCQLPACADGSYPYPGGGLILDRQGNLYGTAGGGAYGAGVAFELTPGSQGWTETVLYSFQGQNDGSAPQMPLTFDSNGNLYGTTVAGGANLRGVAFELEPSSQTWTETTLHAFCSEPGCSDGENPDSGLTFDSSGNLYGTTTSLVYQLAPSNGSWTESVLLKESHKGGGGFSGTLLFSAGNLYGTAEYGGADGLAYALVKTISGWREFDYDFNGRDGENPTAGLVRDKSGNFDGVAGSTFDCGLAYSLSRRKKSANETILYNFTGGLDGCDPIGPLAQDPSGRFYGVAQAGGTYNEGVVYQLFR